MGPKPKQQKKRTVWSKVDELFLLKLWKEKFQQLRGNRKNNHVYREMANSFQSRNSLFSPDEIRVKIHNITSRYRKEKQLIGPSGSSASEWKLYHRVHAILGQLKVHKLEAIVDDSIATGFCIKTFKLNTNEKYFINVCQTDEIPSPEDITEEELTKILQSDEPSSFRIPMSISEPRTTKDKSNNPCDVCDIAVNPKFFSKIEKSMLFRDFFLALIAEALSDKYNIQVKVDKSIIMTNRKFIGTLVAHRIRNNDVKTVLETYKNPSAADNATLTKFKGNTANKPLVQELSDNEINILKKQSDKFKEEQTVKIKEAISLAASTVPEFKLRAKVKGENVDEIQAELYMPKCISSEEISLDVGEDRILVESMKHGYLFDKFVNYKLDQDRVNAVFDKTNKMLQVRVAVATA